MKYTFWDAAWMLCRYPFCMSLEEVGELTDEQLDKLFNDKPPFARPKPGDGGSSQPKSATYVEVFWSVWRQRGLSDAEIAAKWRQEGHGG